MTISRVYKELQIIKKKTMGQQPEDLLKKKKDIQIANKHIKKCSSS